MATLRGMAGLYASTAKADRIRRSPASFPSAANRRARRIANSGRCKNSDAPWRPSGGWPDYMPPPLKRIGFDAARRPFLQQRIGGLAASRTVEDVNIQTRHGDPPVDGRIICLHR